MHPSIHSFLDSTRQQARQFWGNLGLRAKWISVIYLSVFSVFIILLLVVIGISGFFARSEITQANAMTVQSINASIENTQRYMLGLAEYCNTNPDILSLLSEEPSPALLPKTNFLQWSKNQMDFVSIVIYNADGEAVDYMSIDASYGPQSQTMQSQPFSQLMSGESTYIWEYLAPGSSRFMTVDYSPKLCLWHVLKDLKTTEPIGVVALCIDSRKILGGEVTIDWTGRDPVLVIDDTLSVVFNRSLLEPDPAEISSIFALAQGQKSGHFSHTVQNNTYEITFERLAGTNMYSFLFSASSAFSWQYRTYYVFVLISLIVFLIALLPALSLATTRIIRPIAKLAQSMKSFAAGDYSAKVNFHYRDEIGQLGRIFNDMVKQNQQLIEQKYVLELKEKEAELSALEAQINPHFLNNLLNSVYWMSLAADQPQLSDAIHTLGQYFHSTLSKGKKYVSLQEDLDIAQYYLKLQKIRYGDRLTFSTDISPDALLVTVPKLIIQPITENSILHGAKGISYPLAISISAYTEQDMLVLTITDNGVGMSEEVLSQVFASSSNRPGSGNHLALRNIRDRLALTYEHYRLDITSSPGAGTVIRIELPTTLSNTKEVPVCSK